MIKQAPLSTLIALVCVALSIAPENVNLLLEFDRQAILSGEVWRVWTGHLVHFSGQHAAIDIGSLYLFSKMVELRITGCQLLAFIFAVASLISVALIFMFPELTVYRGASGILTALGILAGGLVWKESPELKIAISAVAVLLIVKTWIDVTDSTSFLSSLPIGVHVAWQAHLIGALLGIFLPTVFLLFSELNLKSRGAIFSKKDYYL